VEYLELLNLSDSAQDLSDFTLEAYNSSGQLIAGWPGRIPEGTRIQPYQHLIVTVDNTDAAPAPAHLCGSGLSFQRAWGFSGVGMIFDEFANTIDKTFDLLPDAGGSVVLRDGQARQVDAVEYESFQVAPFVSLERADPGARFDSDGDGFFDGWYPCEALEKATPGQTNENKGMYTEETPLLKTKHDPAQITIFNRPLVGLQELARIPAGESWKLLALEDISKMADHFSLQPLSVDQYLGGDFRANGSFFESQHKGDSGVWESGAAYPGSYYLSVISAGSTAQGQRVRLDYKTDTMDAFSPSSSLVFSDQAALYGFVELPAGTKSAQVRIINEADVFISLAKIILEPAMIVKGRINVNTAEREVLQSILSDDLTAKILSSRPVGNRGADKLGLGDLFLIDKDFMPLHNLLTVKSNIFEILCRGESSAAALAQQSIRTVVDRAE
jgi:hypothetical protein